MLRLTLLTSAIASGTFVVTLAFAPAVVDVGQLFGFESNTVPAISQPAVIQQVRECAPLAKVVAALQQRQCVP